MNSEILEYINKDKLQRDTAIEIAKSILDEYSLSPKTSGFINYTYRLSDTTIAKFQPWLQHSNTHKTLLNKEAMFNIKQMNAIAPDGVGCELGVFEGGVSKMLMSLGRKMICFDTFEGIIGSQEIDLLKNGEFCTKNEQEVREYLKDAIIVKGDIMDTLSKIVLIDQIAFVHLDMDVYEPTKYALDTLWPQLKSGGVIILDDYGVWCTPGIKIAVDNFITENGGNIKKIYFPTGQIALIKD